MKQQDVIAFFDRLAPSWDAEMIRDDRIIGAILDAAEITCGVSVLDVGCGTGVLFPDYLNRQVGSLTGIDLSPAMVEIARKKFADSRITVLCGDAAVAAYPSRFDRCVVYNAFPHFPEPEKLIGHLSAQLLSGGRLTIAHGMSRRAIDAHHSGTARKVSVGLMEEGKLAELLRPYFLVDAIVSDEEKYWVSGRKRDDVMP